MIFSSRSYAVGLAHYQIAGGHRGLALLSAAYVAGIGVVFGLLFYNVRATEVPQAMRVVSAFLLVLQSFGLVVFGSGRIASCIRLDLITNMMESHRLMPVSSWRIVISYMLGTTSQLIILLAMNAVVMLLTHGLAGIPFESFVLGQMVLAFFAIMIWSFTAMCGFMFRQAMTLMILGLVGGGIASAILRQIGILPAITILASPFLGETIFNLSSGAVNPRALYAIALPAQLAFGILFFIGACRRYRGAYYSTFNVGMGIALVALWGLLSLIAIYVWPLALRSYPRMIPQQPDVPAQIVAALIASAVLVVVPVHALAAWEHARGLSMTRRGMALAAIIFAACLPVFARQDINAWLLTAMVLAFHVATLFSAYRFTRGMSALASGVLVISLFLVLWLCPLFIELIRWIVQDYPGFKEELSVISTFSPLGLLMRVWNSAPGKPTLIVGFLFQAMFTAFAWDLGRRRRARLAADSADSPAASAVLASA